MNPFVIVIIAVVVAAILLVATSGIWKGHIQAAEDKRRKRAKSEETPVPSNPPALPLPAVIKPAAKLVSKVLSKRPKTFFESMGANSRQSWQTYLKRRKEMGLPTSGRFTREPDILTDLVAA